MKIVPGLTRRTDNGHVVKDVAMHTNKQGKQFADGIWFLDEEGKQYLYPLWSATGYDILSKLETPEPTQEHVKP